MNGAHEMNGTAGTDERAIEPVVSDRTDGSAEGGGRLVERDEKRVPVTEAIRYRKRAQEAEREREELASSLEELRSALDESRTMLIESERRRHVDSALTELRSVDLETARVMLEGSIGGEADEGTIRKAAAELRRKKPFLFRSCATPSGGSSMGGRPRRGADPLESHARAATETGDRKALMRYLRVRRDEGSS